MKIIFTISLALAGLACVSVANDPEAGSCFGTDSGLSVGEDRIDHYWKMHKRYSNCTRVKGNLEITGIESPSMDVSFLKNIKEVTGYVIIALNYVPYLSLENLRIIRGRELFQNQSLIITVNYNKEDPKQGLRELRLKSLTEIVRGNVKIRQNPQLCFADTINWQDILNPAAKKNGWTTIAEDSSSASCGSCNESCDGRCWGKGPNMCQTMTLLNCSSACKSARCYGPRKEECCDAECAGGCTGPKNTDCLICLHVNNSGSCEYSCPPALVYDPQTQRHVKNPKYKFHYHDQCVDKCPSNLLIEHNGCVKSCRKGYHNNGTGTCVQCKDKKCDKECFGVKHSDGPLAKASTVNAANVKYFKGCNIVKGNIIFYSYVFKGDNHTNLAPLTATMLTESFKDVKVITGYLHIVSWPKELTDFSVFKNLQRVDGVDLYKDLASLIIQDSVHPVGPFYLTHITSLGFTSLKQLTHGNVYIGYLRNLCYDRLVNWTSIVKAPVSFKTFDKGVLLRNNKPADQCQNVTCHPFCENGCWGPSLHQCVSCRSNSYNGACLDGCSFNLGIYEVPGERECATCDSHCNLTCTGPGPGNCSSCKLYRFNGDCVDECPIDKYPDPITKECKQCHNSCVIHEASPQCTGPKNTLDEGGCNYCDYAITTRRLDAVQCLPIGQLCPVGYYQLERSQPTVTAKHTCMPCYEGCTNCTGFSKEDCLHHIGTPLLVVILIPVFILSLLILVGLAFFHKYRQRQLRKKRQHSMRALGIDPSPEDQSADPRVRLMEPMTPSGVAPNQAQLRIVKEAELRIGKVLGSGAFGTVHKGYWIPDLAPRERVKVPVAIKVLRDESSQVASNEILDEAFVMASCEHPNLVRLLGISLSHQIMLISQLMPLGNLLEYVRDNKDNIGSQHLLNWSLQIAKGMRYLAEEKHLVHRDLAARNVLVKSPNHVRITDFGLAKLLDVNEDVYRAEGGKMPIKWLALESIQHRIFTQKSDVWSFGVTMWELMTFGKKPYENIPATDVHILLEKGERLLQPHICTIDIYMMLIKCWTVDADARPTFRELCDELSKMARDPQRYVVVDNEGTFTELPSPTTSEFLRSLVHEEGDDFPITDAEDYLHPQVDIRPDLDGPQFRLQQPPLSVPWKRQLSSTSSQQHLLGRRFGSGRQMSMNYDRRLDSVMTTMTNLSSVSGHPPNGASTPFASVTQPPHGELLGEGHEIVLGDALYPQTPVIFQGTHGTPFIPRTISESSDVFSNSPVTKRAASGHAGLIDGACVGHDPNHTVRSREDSTTMRYSAEPVSLLRQQTQPNGKSTKPTVKFEHDEEGYLSPAEAANKMPEYLDTSEFPPSPFALSPPINIFDMSAPNPSSLSNPEYEAAFLPAGAKLKPQVDDDGYEVPVSGCDVEYENTCPLATKNEPMLSLRHSSQSGESSTSEKRDSGMQSDDDDVRRKSTVAVANPNYDFLENVKTGDKSATDVPEYVNTAQSDSEKGDEFKDDDIFTLFPDKHSKFSGKDLVDPVMRTYSEPDSGVGIEVAVDNLLYHKLGNSWTASD